jgi:acyl carrier protein
MSLSESSSASTAANSSDAAHALMRHFPDDVRAAYKRFAATRSADDADIVILAAVVDHIPDKARRSAGTPADEQKLIEDLGFDSVAIAELVFFLEDLFQMKISNEEILQVRSVGDMRRFVRQKIAAASA